MKFITQLFFLLSLLVPAHLLASTEALNAALATGNPVLLAKAINETGKLPADLGHNSTLSKVNVEDDVLTLHIDTAMSVDSEHPKIKQYVSTDFSVKACDQMRLKPVVTKLKHVRVKFYNKHNHVFINKLVTKNDCITITSSSPQ